jgi:hypothetical protein
MKRSSTEFYVNQPAQLRHVTGSACNTCVYRLDLTDEEIYPEEQIGSHCSFFKRKLSGVGFPEECVSRVKTISNATPIVLAIGYIWELLKGGKNKQAGGDKHEG